MYFCLFWSDIAGATEPSVPEGTTKVYKIRVEESLMSSINVAVRDPSYILIFVGFSAAVSS